jgi:hypothetical protein
MAVRRLTIACWVSTCWCEAKLLCASDEYRARSRFALFRSACLGALRDGGVQRGLERARIDHRQHVAFLHLLALGDRHLHQRAIDAAAHLDGVECLHRSKAAEIQRDILTDTTGDGHRNGSGRTLRARLLCARPIGQAESEARPGSQQDRNSDCQLPAHSPGAVLDISHDPKTAPPPSPVRARPCCAATYTR